jgi:ABC-type glycerol-3-phosphate transport system substrate-binding protein
MRQVYRKKTEAQPPPEAVEIREKTMNAKMLCSILGAASFGLAASAQAETTLTIATVNNPDMIVMQKYSTKFEAQTGIKLKWLVLEENVLRQRVTTDISTNGGQFDIITIGLFETPLWGKAGWLAPFDDLSASYDLPDVLQTVRNSLSYEGKLYSLPFYAESAMTYYRTDVFKKAGLTMPEKPTWDQIAEFADKVNDPAHGVYGVCLRGQPGWGENMGLLGVVANAFGGQLFDVNWKSGYTDEGWKKAINFYVKLMQKDGPPGAVGNGFNENLALFASGHCAQWVDATVAAGILYDPKRSQVADKVSFAEVPTEVPGRVNGWLWSWALGIPKSSKQVDAATKFIEWATSKDYIKMIGESDGWVTVPPGTRKSTYANPEYQKAAPFAKVTLDAINTADLSPTKDKPYAGIGAAVIPEMQAIGTFAGQQVAAALTGKTTVDAALDAAAANADRTLQQAGGYQK